jgi:hypothetical protein
MPDRGSAGKLDPFRRGVDNGSMKNDDDTLIPPDVLADAQLVAECVAAGKPVPPEVARRVREDAARITERLRQKYGELDIGVPAIRELRDE